MPSARFDNASDWIENIIRDFIDASGENRLENEADDRAFDTPLIGFSSGDDPLYEAYKEYVGPFHWTPLEVFRSEFPSSDAKAGELTVVSWILPHIRATKRDNRTETLYPAERWARARIFGEEVNVKLRKRVIEKLRERGFDAVAPALRPDWEMKTGVKYVFASTWSERHAAHASGLGTFGLCDGLITPKGKAVRVGSVIARIDIPATPRPYDKYYAYCLFLNEGSCGKCISRCPVEALSEKGHDKLKCIAHLHPTTNNYVESNFGFHGYGCGLCQTGVPCESTIPKSRKHLRRSSQGVAIKGGRKKGYRT